jgi:AraC-like DNA-binding protein
VLQGGYEEAGDAGRFKVAAGDVLLHAPFSAHCDVVTNAKTVVLDLPLPFDAAVRAPRGRVRDPDAISALAKRDSSAAMSALFEVLEPEAKAEADLPDMLARDLGEDASVTVGAWAAANGVSRETIWRHFRSAYGVDIASYRAETRARKAWRMLIGETAPLAGVAAAAGFADQPHMSREVKALTGRTPGAWRRLATSVQDGAFAAP